MDFVEGLLSFVGGAFRVLFGILEAIDFVDLLGWWVLYLIPAPLWAAGAFMAFGGPAHPARGWAAAVAAFMTGVVSTVVWARKSETAGYITWGGAAAGLIMVLVHAVWTSPI